MPQRITNKSLEKNVGKEVVFEKDVSRVLVRGTLRYDNGVFYMEKDDERTREFNEGDEIYLLQGQKTGRGVVKQFRPYIYSS